MGLWSTTKDIGRGIKEIFTGKPPTAEQKQAGKIGVAAGIEGLNYLRGGEMGVDPNSYNIGNQWTGQMDAMGAGVQGRGMEGQGGGGGMGMGGGQQGQANFIKGMNGSLGALTMGKGGAIGPGRLGAAPPTWSEQAKSLYGSYQDVLNGKTPSVAQQQLRQGLEGAVAGQRSMAASANPLARAAMERAGAANVAGLQQGAIGQSAILRAQEQDAARQGMSGLVSDYSQMQLQQQGMNDAMTQFYMSQGFGRDQAQQQANAQMESQKGINATTAMGQTGVANQTPQQQSNLGPTITALGDLGAAYIGRKR